jgi:TRAP-type C4-dicarboxylate transport system substrate-binding protein
MVRIVRSLACAVLLGVAAKAAADPIVLKVGVLAPEKSPWGQVFTTWQRVLTKRSNGAFSLQFFWNGSMGDERAMIEKVRTGQLDVTSVTSAGLSTISRDVLALQLPGAFKSWEMLDAGRERLRPKLEAKFQAAGFRILGWGDVGALKTMSRGFKVNGPQDLRGRGVYAIANDVIGPAIYGEIGIPYKTLGITEILPALAGGTIDVVNAPPLGAEQLQWSSKIDHVNTRTAVFAIGGLILSETRYKGLPPDAQKMLEETGAQVSKVMTTRIRQEDAAAFDRLKAKVTVYESDAAGEGAWRALLLKVIPRLRGQTFDPAIFDEVAALVKAEAAKADAAKAGTVSP